MEKYKISNKIIDPLKNFEGDIEYQSNKKKSFIDGKFRIHDDGARYPTIGYGHKIKSNELERFKDGISSAEAEQLLREDLDNVENDLNRIFKTPLSQNEVDALGSFIFNVGGGANVSNSNTVYMINKNLDFNPITGKTLEEEFKEWNTSKGQVLNGLIDRRNKEWEIFSNGNY